MNPTQPPETQAHNLSPPIRGQARTAATVTCPHCPPLYKSGQAERLPVTIRCFRWWLTYQRTSSMWFAVIAGFLGAGYHGRYHKRRAARRSGVFAGLRGRGDG